MDHYDHQPSRNRPSPGQPTNHSELQKRAVVFQEMIHQRGAQYEKHYSHWQQDQETQPPQPQPPQQEEEVVEVPGLPSEVSITARRFNPVSRRAKHSSYSYYADSACKDPLPMFQNESKRRTRVVIDFVSTLDRYQWKASGPEKKTWLINEGKPVTFRLKWVMKSTSKCIRYCQVQVL